MTVLFPLAIFALSACGEEGTSEDPEDNGSDTQDTVSAAPTPEEEPEESELDAESIAEALQSDIDTITDYTLITEDNDPNDLIGRPNGYTEALVIYDSEADCQSLGVDCGATVEFWADEDAATERSDYIQDTLADAPFLGSEYHFQSGSILLRVAGEITPSQSETYEAAFGEVTE
ncbi:hypothetical protein GCM10023354_16680 [Garicola koreensis]